MRAGTLYRRGGEVVSRAPSSAVIARLSLGLMVLAAGVHKLLDPGAWAVYVVDWLAPWLVVSPVVFTLINGYREVGFGLALLADRYTGFVSLVAGRSSPLPSEGSLTSFATPSLVAAVSLTATVGYLVIVFATQGAFGDVLARDVGLAGLGWAVFVGSMRPENG